MFKTKRESRMANPCTTPPPAPCVPAVSDARVLQSFTRRFNTATKQALVTIPAHSTNGDEEKYADKCGTYTKCIKQASAGKVDLAAYATFSKAISSGLFSDFEAVTLGGGRTLNGPMGSYAYTFYGADATQFGEPVVPPAPALASEAY